MTTIVTIIHYNGVKIKYEVFNGYSTVGIFTGICLAVSLLVFITSGVLSRAQAEKAGPKTEPAA
jgi:hypothetical protein